jgi:hypothetical protein
MNQNLKNNLIMGALLAAAPATSTEFVAIERIAPGQSRYASLNVEEKVIQAQKRGGALRNNGRWVPAYRNGTTIFTENNALPVVRSPQGLILVDGHHDVRASIALGATEVPIKIIADLSGLSLEEFWRVAEEKGYVYPYAKGGIYRRPARSFMDMEDDSNRYFAAITARKCLDSRTENAHSIGADYPLWIKVGKDIPFIEFKIADTLYEHGFIYDLNEQNTPSDETIEKARAILTAHTVPGLRLVKSRTYYADIPLLCALTLPQ